MKKFVVASMVMAGVGLAACSSSGPSATTTTTTSTTVGNHPLITAPTTVPTTAAPTTTTAAAPSGPCVSASGCAQALYSDWANGDQTDAANVASSAAVTQMFSSPYAQLQTDSGPVGPYQMGPTCSGSAPATCTWSGQDQQLQMIVTPTGGEFEVTQVNRLGG